MDRGIPGEHSAPGRRRVDLQAGGFGAATAGLRYSVLPQLHGARTIMDPVSRGER